MIKSYKQEKCVCIYFWRWGDDEKICATPQNVIFEKCVINLYQSFRMKSFILTAALSSNLLGCTGSQPMPPPPNPDRIELFRPVPNPNQPKFRGLSQTGSGLGLTQVTTLLIWNLPAPLVMTLLKLYSLSIIYTSDNTIPQYLHKCYLMHWPFHSWVLWLCISWSSNVRSRRSLLGNWFMLLCSGLFRVKWTIGPKWDPMS